MDSAYLLELELGCSRAMCCSPVCVLLRGQRNSLYTHKSLSCLSVGFFVLKAAMVIDCYSWLLLVWLVISPHPSSQEKETQSAVISARSSLDSCRLFSRCMAVSPSPPACATSVVILLSCLSSVFLGLAGLSPLEDAPGGSMQNSQPCCLTGS